MNCCAKQVTVLLAEDSYDVRHVVSTLLKTNGFHVLMGADGRQALEVSRAFAGEIEILLADIEMPELNGIELARQIEIERPHTRILLMSGYVSHEGIVRANQPFIPKPFSIEELVRRMRELLKCRGRAAPVG